ncbi:protein of unknown function [Bradyrhizobium vignae]|uniref:Uncharacterized protein n=1 Tax=Bradyrhizobium vignae TaxID=1549949 RepID=A0A2U3Q704_9BRAD|nr:protein of unknown function [Bradyrhizobium vignae]
MPRQSLVEGKRDARQVLRDEYRKWKIRFQPPNDVNECRNAPCGGHDGDRSETGTTTDCADWDRDHMSQMTYL